MNVNKLEYDILNNDQSTPENNVKLLKAFKKENNKNLLVSIMVGVVNCCFQKSMACVKTGNTKSFQWFINIRKSNYLVKYLNDIVIENPLPGMYPGDYNSMGQANYALEIKATRVVWPTWIATKEVFNYRKYTKNNTFKHMPKVAAKVRDICFQLHFF